MRLPDFDNAAIFSPHYDDAVLSMGDMIAHLGKDVSKNITIYNVFTKSSDLQNDLTKRLVSQAGFRSHQKYFESRRDEDKKAIKVLGKHIKVVDMGFVDAAWRQINGLAVYPKTTWGIEPSFLDEQLVDQIIARMFEIKRDHKNLLTFAPVGRGKEHVDHVIVRDAASKTFKDLIHYADFDYGVNYPANNRYSLENQLEPVKFSNNGQKIQAVLEYKTQLRGLFGDNIPKKLNREIYYFSK